MLNVYYVYHFQKVFKPRFNVICTKKFKTVKHYKKLSFAVNKIGAIIHWNKENNLHNSITFNEVLDGATWDVLFSGFTDLIWDASLMTLQTLYIVSYSHWFCLPVSLSIHYNISHFCNWFVLVCFNTYLLKANILGKEIMLMKLKSSKLIRVNDIFCSEKTCQVNTFEVIGQSFKWQNHLLGKAPQDLCFNENYSKILKICG